MKKLLNESAWFVHAFCQLRIAWLAIAVPTGFYFGVRFGADHFTAMLMTLIGTVVGFVLWALLLFISGAIETLTKDW